MNPQELQIEYYQKIAPNYNEIYVDEEHLTACRLISSLCSNLEVSSILDTGCGIGRNIIHLKNYFPQAKVIGNDISPDLLRIATDNYQIPSEDLVCCSSYELPFADNSFDIITEFAMLHHVAEPERVVAEMLRVARKAIFISDGNRFAQGRLSSRFTKLFLYKMGLWWMLRQLMNGGKRWSYSEADGVFYSYSVFDNLNLIEAACPTVFALPTKPVKGAALSPLLFAENVLLCGFKS